MKNMRAYDIVNYVKTKKRCTTAELMHKFGVSSATIHRDLADLSASGALHRIHGGVVFLDGFDASLRTKTANDFHRRATLNRAAKEKIAAEAVKVVAEGDILFLDSSTTTELFADELTRTRFSNLTIITNSVSVANKFCRMPPNYVLISLGGNYDPLLNSFLGSAALRELDRLTITKAFVSCFGITDRLVTTNHEHQAGLVTRVLEKADHRYLLVDRSKFGRRGLYRLAARGAFDRIFS